MGRYKFLVSRVFHIIQSWRS